MTDLSNPTDENVHGSNPTDNTSLGDLLRLPTRRTVLAGGLAGGALTFLGGAGVLSALPAAAGETDKHRPRPAPPLLGFTAVAASAADDVIVADGYTVDVLVPWGQPILSNGPAWRKDATNSAADQARQIGMNHDGMHYYPLQSGPKGNKTGLLVLNHEYVDQALLFPDGPTPMTAEKVAKALAGHGASVVKIELVGGQWKVVDSKYNRRITGATPMAFSGPVRADHPKLASPLGLPPQGTLNNCAHGFTPWGTYLTCEENWNGYFGTADPTFAPTPTEARYGVTAAGFGYGWHTADPRFDLAQNRNELNRFGWVVEIDPFDPKSKPVKRTALGRIKHEGATFAESCGHAVAYMGDDENGDYFYKYVSALPWRWLKAVGKSPLDHGTLYVAKLAEDGTGEWIPLVFGKGALTAANGWADQADVLLRTRQAADAVGATKLDRPEWCTVHPKTDEVFLTLTNGSNGPTGPNPRNPNPYGHILKVTPKHRDHTRTSFTWAVWMLAGDPAYDATVELDASNIFGSPDGIWIDPDSRMWIQTDISNSSQNRPDRGYDNIKNNQMLAADPSTGEIRRFLVGPRGCEITGVITTPDQQTMFVNVQHPGEATTFWGTPTPAAPQAVSSWPDHDPAGRPRSATLVIRKVGGGKIGS